jgi:hypothetical protein
VSGAPSASFRGFLDGTQRSVVGTYEETIPIVFGSVSAVIRERVERRMCTWREPVHELCIYAPQSLLSAVTWNTLHEAYGNRLIDSTPKGPDVSAHPLALRDCAYQMVQGRREQLERRLAESWCATESAALYVDGGIAGNESVARSRLAIGVVKSHVTLYAEGADVGVVMRLAEGERSSVFRVVGRSRASVASWYLRLRDASSRDPMWGLVRVEIADDTLGDPRLVAERAGEVSAWVLSEVSPLALPDGRWDTMVYGIRDCEEYLRAVTFQT